jgi:hypothetical protein
MSVDWHSDPDVVVKAQLAIAVYENQRGQVCIAQEGEYGDDDVYITVAKDNALAVAQAILEAAGIDLAAPLALPAPKSPANAERPRRYRERHRNGVTPPVTDDRNADPVTLPIAAE